jgi:hypothetical protein
LHAARNRSSSKRQKSKSPVLGPPKRQRSEKHLSASACPRPTSAAAVRSPFGARSCAGWQRLQAPDPRLRELRFLKPGVWSLEPRQPRWLRLCRARGSASSPSLNDPIRVCAYDRVRPDPRSMRSSNSCVRARTPPSWGGSLTPFCDVLANFDQRLVNGYTLFTEGLSGRIFDGAPQGDWSENSSRHSNPCVPPPKEIRRRVPPSPAISCIVSISFKRTGLGNQRVLI